MRSVGAVACALALTATSQPSARPNDPRAVLESYASGHAADVAAVFARLDRPQADALRVQLILDGKKWIADGGAAVASRRALVVAATSLELEAARVDRSEWKGFIAPIKISGRDAIATAAELIKRRPADDAELAWWRVAIALGEAHSDSPFIAKPPAQIFGANVLGTILAPVDAAGQAAKRFPSHKEFDLARARSYLMRLKPVNELASPRAGVPQPPERISPPMQTAETAAERRQQRQELIGQLTGLLRDPACGTEAAIRLGWFLWTEGNTEQGLTTIRAAAPTSEADLRYLAAFVEGKMLETRGDPEGAESAYARALTTRPGSQSAAFALSALRFRRGDIASAEELVNQSFADRKNDDDPWRLFAYGEYRRLPVLLAALRAEVLR